MPAGGRVILLGSVLSRKGAPGSYAYAASKHGLLALVRGMAEELGPRGIRVNAICPSWVDTAMAQQVLERMAQASGKPQSQVTAEMLASQPVRRMLKPSEVAAYISFLIGPGGDGVTGQAIDLSGGSVMV
jgi:3-hydroxybutyrate dehydrogenase